MTKEVAGVNLEAFEDPIRDALLEYQAISDGHIKFRIDKAAVLKPTPDKTTSARSTTPVLFSRAANGVFEEAGELIVMAFEPYLPERNMLDGTGDESFLKLANVEIEPGLPHSTRIMPTSKIGQKPAGEKTRREVHLSILSHEIDNAHADPVLFGGSLALIGYQETAKLVKPIGTLGHVAMAEDLELDPITTYTFNFLKNGNSKQVPFGQPHAVANLSDEIRIGAFFRETELAHSRFGDVSYHLDPCMPKAA